MAAGRYNILTKLGKIYTDACPIQAVAEEVYARRYADRGGEVLRIPAAHEVRLNFSADWCKLNALGASCNVSLQLAALVREAAMAGSTAPAMIGTATAGNPPPTTPLTRPASRNATVIVSIASWLSPKSGT